MLGGQPLLHVYAGRTAIVTWCMLGQPLLMVYAGRTAIVDGVCWEDSHCCMVMC